MRTNITTLTSHMATGEHVSCCEEKEDARSKASQQSILEVIEIDPVSTQCYALQCSAL